MMEARGVSRQHLVLQFNSKMELLAFDLNSTQGTFVNKHKIQPMNFVRVKGGDLINLGTDNQRTIVVNYYGDEEEEQEEERRETVRHESVVKDTA